MSDWTIDAEAKAIKAKAFGGTLIGYRRPADGKWEMLYVADAEVAVVGRHVLAEADEPIGYEIRALCHHIERFGVDGPGAVGLDDAELFATAASWNGAFSIREHLRKHEPERFALVFADRGPGVFVGPDPF